MKAKYKITLALVFSFVLAATYNACGGYGFSGKVVNQETVGGNPMTALSVAAYQQPGDGTSLKTLSVCMKQIILKSSNNALPDQTINFTIFNQQVIPQNGLPLGNLPIPSGTYSQILMALSNVCGTGQSLQVTNGNGTYSTSQDLNLQFSSNVVVASPGGAMTFYIQPIVNNLSKAASNSDVPTDATLSPGTCLSTAPPKRLFVTSTAYTGNLGGLIGADSLCQGRANVAGLGGTWKAWLSDSTTSAISRINDVSPWYLIDMTTLVFPTYASITAAGPAVPLSMNELGATTTVVGTWTNTGANGLSLGGANDCGDWATTTGNGVFGDNLVTGSLWTDDTLGTSSCSNPNSMKFLYCFEQ